MLLWSQGISDRLHRVPAQVVLRWALQKGAVVLPRSSNPLHIRQNKDLFGFELSCQDMLDMNDI